MQSNGTVTKIPVSYAINKLGMQLYITKPKTGPIRSNLYNHIQEHISKHQNQTKYTFYLFQNHGPKIEPSGGPSKEKRTIRCFPGWIRTKNTVITAPTLPRIRKQI